MAKTQLLPVKDLRLDLRNFRTVPQKDEASALSTMISITPDRFWALMDSLLETGYLPTENIIVLVDKKGVYHVKEGNRRIAALKLAFKHLSGAGLVIPKGIEQKLKTLSKEWKDENKEVPCAVYEEKEEELVDKIVALAHGKGEKASRDNWTSVAGARHNRDKSGATETGLDLLEKYLEKGKNLTALERDQWSGVYPITVLDDALGKIAARLGFASARDLMDKYPSTFRKEIEDILKAIGNGQIKFETIRDKTKDFAVVYGVPALPSPALAGGKTQAPTPAATTITSTGATKGVKAVASNDPKSVMRALKAFATCGKGRAKLVTLLNEARSLKLNIQPHAFCFVFRAMFEVSAKAYCADHKSAGLSVLKKDGTEKKLVDVLNEIFAHLTAGKPKTDPLYKDLHGAITELAKPSGLLSVTSMNQLIHSTTFVVDETHICTVFANVFPLLREMN